MKVQIVVSSATTEITGFSIGSTTFSWICHSLAPSMRAASFSSLGIDCNVARKVMMTDGSSRAGRVQESGAIYPAQALEKPLVRDFLRTTRERVPTLKLPRWPTD